MKKQVPRISLALFLVALSVTSALLWSCVDTCGGCLSCVWLYFGGV